MERSLLTRSLEFIKAKHFALGIATLHVQNCTEENGVVNYDGTNLNTSTYKKLDENNNGLIPNHNFIINWICLNMSTQFLQEKVVLTL